MEEFDTKKYNQGLDAMYDSKHALMFSNDTPEKGLATIIKISEFSKHVKIITKSIQGTLYNKQEFMDALQKFLCNNGKIEIIVLDDESYINKYSLFKQEIDNLRLYIYKDTFSIKKIVNKADEKITNFFMLGDDDKFRIEMGDNFKAISCLAKNEFHDRIEKIFDKLNEKSINI